tara:strand:+ start:59 stop:874 length:816 start_codon:yes stop_codon:yes gene_type:complete
MINKISHKTTFEYQTAPKYVLQRLHLTPLKLAHQRALKWEISISGGAIELETVDHHGNDVHICRYYSDFRKIEIICRGTVEVSDTAGVSGVHNNKIPLSVYRNSTALSMLGPSLRRISKEFKIIMRDKSYDELSILHDLSACIAENIRYSKGKTDVNTTAEMAMEIGAGVCQDHVHAFLAVSRSLGFSARYVSGYLMMNKNSVQNASHAWAEIHIHGLGWVGFDVSNGISPDDRYVALATGFDYTDVIPISGLRLGTGGEEISTQISVSQQ